MAKLRSYLDGLAIWTGAVPRVARPRKINLALQGGGAHGAFSWGVADQLLADERIAIAGLSGTSAGALNAVMIADGLARGGRDEARKRLAEFWRAASTGGNLPAVQRAVTDRLFSILPLTTSLHDWFETVARYFSPYDLNPLNINPLKELIERFVDFGAVRDSSLPLFIAATNVHTGRLKIFSRESINADAVMASAALPFLFQAVEIDKVPYWDGGYLSNPPIFPFLRTTGAEDVVVVQINRDARHDAEIVDRDRQPAERDHLQLGAAHRAAHAEQRQPPDRRWSFAERFWQERVPQAQHPPHRPRLARDAAVGVEQTEDRLPVLRPVAPRRPACRATLPRYALRRSGVRSTIDVEAEAGVEWG